MSKNKFQISNFKFQIKKKSVTICVYLWIISFCLFLLSIDNQAQVRAVNDYGAIGLTQLLKKLNTTKSVLMIGAHPDDEDSALLAYLARGENARTAYLSLTRGDGGQNIIGSELFESLGVIRTEELLQARRLDGAEQFFTRAFDFGFTKTLAETKQKWDEKVILCDAVNVIRTFRPLVVISRFAGTPTDGHGQHQYSGYISPLAVRAAADESQCKNSGAAWQVQKFYVEQGFRATGDVTLKINTGEYNPLLGRSYAEIAAEGRSQHKTQEQGGIEPKGDRFSGLNLVESVAPKVENEKSIFDGIDTSIIGALKISVKDKNIIDEFTRSRFSVIQQSAERALKEYDSKNPQNIIASLIDGEKAAQELYLSYLYIPRSEKNRKKQEDKLKNEGNLVSISNVKSEEFNDAIKLALGIKIDVLSDKETVAPGENFFTAVNVYFPKTVNVKVKEIDLDSSKTFNDWTISKIEKPTEANRNSFQRESASYSAYFNVKVPQDEHLTEPYYLEEPRDDGFYNWELFDSDNKRNLTLPFQPPLMLGCITIDIDGTEIILNQPVEYRYADGIRGEIRRELNVVPRISLNPEQNLVVVSQTRKAQTKKIILNVVGNSSADAKGVAKLNVAEKWRVEPAQMSFDLAKKGAKTSSLEFSVIIPADVKSGEYEISASVESNGEKFDQTMHTIAYPHIQTHRYYTDAITKIDILDLKIAPVKVGYIMGSGDEVPEAIRQMGLAVDLLGEKDLSGGDLAKYDVIVAGIRAYQVREDLIANNQKVWITSKKGGTLIVQYQRPDYAANNLTPFPADMNDTQKTTAGTTARVVDENAKVTILDANSPVFNFPNKITDNDFANWVQERNLYNFVTFDKNYTPLLEAHDAGELENKGGMVYAKVGKGNYVYTSYSFFRQFPAAFRARIVCLPIC